jgi:hypothetical protein
VVKYIYMQGTLVFLFSIFLLFSLLNIANAQTCSPTAEIYDVSFGGCWHGVVMGPSCYVPSPPLPDGWTPPPACPEVVFEQPPFQGIPDITDIVPDGLPLPPPPTPPPPTPPPPPSAATTFAATACITVNTESVLSLNVRDAASGNRIGSHPNGTTGTILSGGQSSGGYVWWEVDFTSDPDGWVAEDFIKLCTTPSPQVAGATLDEIFLGAYVTPDTEGDGLNVRLGPDGNLLGEQRDSARGIALAGPVTQSGFEWWFVDFENGVDGYVAGEFLEMLTGENEHLVVQGPDWPAVDIRNITKSAHRNTVVDNKAYSAEIVDINVPKTMRVNEVATITVRLKNTGTEEWKLGTLRTLNTVRMSIPNKIQASAHWIDHADDGQFNRESFPVMLPDNVAPNAEVTLTTTIRAPVDGLYPFAVDLKDKSNRWFGIEMEPIMIEVGNPNARLTDCPPDIPSHRIMSWDRGWTVRFGNVLQGIARDHAEEGESMRFCGKAFGDVYIPEFFASNDSALPFGSPPKWTRSFYFTTNSNFYGVGFYPGNQRLMRVIPPPQSGLQIEECQATHECRIEAWTGVGEFTLPVPRPGVYIVEMTGIIEELNTASSNFVVGCTTCGDVIRTSGFDSPSLSLSVDGRRSITINRGESVDLSWNAPGGVHCRALAGPQEWLNRNNGAINTVDIGTSGNIIVSPQANSTYAVQCLWPDKPIPDHPNASLTYDPYNSAWATVNVLQASASEPTGDTFRPSTPSPLSACSYGACSESQAAQTKCSNEGVQICTGWADGSGLASGVRYCWTPPIYCPASGTCLRESATHYAYANTLCSTPSAISALNNSNENNINKLAGALEGLKSLLFDLQNRVDSLR